MRDPFPGSPILRLGETRAAAKPTSADILSARQQTEVRSYPEQMDRWAMLHAPDPAVARIRALRLADADLSGALDAAL